MRIFKELALTGLLLGGCQVGKQEPASPISSPLPAARAASVERPPPAALGCELGETPVTEDGKRRLALLVAVSDYQSPKIHDLRAPEEDVLAMARLLTDPKGGYGFPAQNVCVLTGEAATVAGVKQAFREALTARVGSPEDEVVFYFSGHGSQVFDSGGDEADGWDETFVLYDSRMPGVRDLRDDEMNELLVELHAKTTHITMLIDSCNSGGLARGGEAVVERLVVAEVDPVLEPEAPGAGDEGGWWSRDLPGVVVLSAARDGTAALEPEVSGMGFFTQALIEILAPVGEQPLTWSEVAIKLPPRIAVLSNDRQQPVLQGQLDRFVFDARERSRPLGYEVVELGTALKLQGYPLPGWGEGATLRIVPASAQRGEARDPALSKGIAIVRSLSGDAVVAELVSEDEPIALGDLAVLAVPGPDAWRLPVRYAAGEEVGALSSAQVAAMNAALDEASDISLLLKRDQPDGMLVASGEDGRLRIRGPEGRTRVVLPGVGAAAQAREAVEALGRFGRQRAILNAPGEGGTDFIDDKTLELRVVRSNHSAVDDACNPRSWPEACPNQEHRVPLCGVWELRVKNTHPSQTLNVSLAIFSSNGDIKVIPKDGSPLNIPPGQERNPDTRELYEARVPVDVLDYVVAIGQATDTARNPMMQLQGFVGEASTKVASKGVESPLGRLLGDITSGAKGQGALSVGEVSSWTRSVMPVRSVTNIQFLGDSASEQACETTASREYTVKDFDVRPYLPMDHESALYKVLRTAHELANASEADGIPYKQHDWSGASDADNLAEGIDCSRSIWYAFTRSGLRYNADDAYLWTGDMIGGGSPMAEEFEDCLDEPELRTGDVLVYFGKNSKGHETGHTVMVIDAARRIAWGSHGWDGTRSEQGQRVPDTGVEYQQIKSREDWSAWDLSSISLKACWRYKDFNETPPWWDELPVGGVACDRKTCEIVPQ
ncbi:MAG: caspase family protein [Alphaproteobacteria bacterium]|nr:caspase family protein [Alphaproteobacteria bacterium]